MHLRSDKLICMVLDSDVSTLSALSRSRSTFTFRLDFQVLHDWLRGVGGATFAPHNQLSKSWKFTLKLKVERKQGFMLTRLMDSLYVSPISASSLYSTHLASSSIKIQSHSSRYCEHYIWSNANNDNLATVQSSNRIPYGRLVESCSGIRQYACSHHVYSLRLLCLVQCVHL
jgi:hypothetical protein